MSVLPIQPEKTKENYAKFLESDFWIRLSKSKRKAVGKCERCGTKRGLQSHHKVYPENWWATTEAMLEVLCRGCHLAQHGLPDNEAGVVVVPEDSEIPEHAFNRPAKHNGMDHFEFWEEVLDARSKRMITRAQFKELEIDFAKRNRLRRKMPLGLKKKMRRRLARTDGWMKWKPRGWKPRMGWVNRGTSSN